MVNQAQALDRGPLGTPSPYGGMTLGDLITLRNIQFLSRLGTSAQSVNFTESKLPGGKNDRS